MNKPRRFRLSRAVSALVAVSAVAAATAPTAGAVLNTTTPSQVALSGAPGAFTNQRSFTISLTTEATSLLKCREGLDNRNNNAAWSNCGGVNSLGSHNLVLTDLPDGTYYYDIWAVNYNYYNYLTTNAQSTAPAVGPIRQLDFTVDTVAPDAPSISSAVVDATVTQSTSQSVSFTGEANATFQCSVDGGSYTACTSPLALNSLTDGAHTVRVKQTDRATNQSTASDVSWTVDTTAPAAPQLSGAPSANTSTTSANISFTGEAGATFTCSVNGGAYEPCTSPQDFSGLADGPHSLSVKATDAAGNTSDAGSASWTVDTVAPDAPQLSGAPSSLTNSSNANISFTGEAGATFTCSVDGGAYAPCTSPQDFSGLADGPHSLSVKAVDAAGNTSDAGSASWTVDTSGPTVDVTGAPSGTDTTGAASISLSSENGATFECKVDNGAWATCSSPVALSNLSDGAHSISVRATDAAGNTGATVTKRWTVRKPFYPVEFTRGTTVTKLAGRGTPWVLSLSVVTHNGGADTRGGAYALTVQVSNSKTKPSDSQPYPTSPSYAQGILTYSETMRRRELKKQPMWIRVGTKVGKWTTWQAVTRA